MKGEKMEDQENTNEVVEETTTEESVAEEGAPPPTEKSKLRSDEIIEIEWPEVEHLFKANAVSQQLESSLASLCLQFEKRKQNLLSRMQEAEAYVYNHGSALRDSKGIDSELTYELKLPANQGEKGFFVRKNA